MTKTLKLEVSVDNIGENGAIASTFATTEFVQTELNKKVNLTPEGKVDHTQLPDYTYISGLPEALEDERILREEAEATTLSQAKTYSDQKLSETAAKKADLIEGKVPFTQLPYNINLEQNIANEFIAVRDEIKQTSDGLVSQIATLDTDLTAYVDSKDTERKDYIDRALFTFLEDLDLRYNEASTRLQGEVDAVVAASQTKVDAEVLKLKKGETVKFDQAISDAIGGYPLHARIGLDNGDIVKSTVAANTVNPNADMTGWVKTNTASQIIDASGISQQVINNQIKTPIHYNMDATGSTDVTSKLAEIMDPTGKYVIQLTKGTYLTNGYVVPPNTIVYANGAVFKRSGYSGKPVIDVGEGSIILGVVVDGNKEALGVGGAISDSGIRLQSNAVALFSVSKNNRSHSITMRHPVTGQMSENQMALFCRAEGNGFNPGGSGTADGFNALNSNNFLFFGCNSKDSARTGFVGETYNPVTSDVDISLSTGGRCVQCVESGSGYNGFNFEKVTSPVFDGLRGGGLYFRGSPNAKILNCTQLDRIYGELADYPIISNVHIKNASSASNLLFLSGKSPKVSNITVDVGDAVTITSSATVEILTSDGKGNLRDISVNRAWFGVKTNVTDASGLSVETASAGKFLLMRSGGSININTNLELVSGLLRIRQSAVPTLGSFIVGDMVFNNSPGNSIYAWQCTTAGVDGAAIWKPIGVIGASKMATQANSVATDLAGIVSDFNALLTKLKNSNFMS